ncbi:protein kinase [Oxalobacteraceae bacterium OTU3CINTB1]|nr:protein kinase [Oxalobacteraceae bacterium OTU3CINTB1]
MALISKTRAELAKVSVGVELGEQLGVGGNGVVYAGVHPTLGEVAVKFLLNDNKKRYGRFCDEVKVVTERLKNSPRVLPILEFVLTNPSFEVPYYVMPTARPVSKVLAGASLDAKLLAFAELAEALTEIHRQEVAHRDIKPENLFFFEGTYRFGDFGIASFPEKLALTEKNEPMGPWAFMANEMLTSPKTADPFKADVYSLAKTVWSLITEEKIPFSGQYSAVGREGLTSVGSVQGAVVEPLESLLSDCTNSKPSLRPTAAEFSARIRDVIKLQSDFRSGNTAQWAAAELDAVSGPGLVRATWETVEHIASALGVLSRRDGLNHFFFPEGGGQQISGVNVCENGSMLALTIPYSGKLILKPKRLTLERFIGKPELGYAVLETEEIAPLGASKKYATKTSEELRQIGDCDYLTDDREDDEPVNGSFGIGCERRFAKGVFVFAPTGGVYNTIDDYQGNMQALGLEGLRRLFQGYFEELTAEDAVTSMQLIPIVRLLNDSTFARAELVLEYLDIATLQQLIELDDEIAAEHKNANVNGRENILDLILEGATVAERKGQQLLASLTIERVAECLSLVNIGRKVRSPADMAESTAENIKAKHSVDYVLEKFGYSFLRKAIARFGLSVVMPTPTSTNELETRK